MVRRVEQHASAANASPWRRHVLAALTLGLIGGAVFFEFRPPSNSFESMAQAACWRMAPLTGAIWLAYYHIMRLPRWIVLTFPFILAVAVLRPRALIVLLPMFVFILWLWPRKPPPRRPTQDRVAQPAQHDA